MLIRLQLGIFALIFIVLLYKKYFKTKLLIIYFITSFTGAWLSLYGGFIDIETFGSGVTAFLRSWNANYFFTGFIIFNPIRLLQYLQAMYSSFIFIDQGEIIWAKLLNIPSIIILSFYWKYIFNAFFSFNNSLKSSYGCLIIFTLSFLLTWLMNPTINTRYVMLMVPFLILLGIASKSKQRT